MSSNAQREGGYLYSMLLQGTPHNKTVLCIRHQCN